MKNKFSKAVLFLVLLSFLKGLIWVFMIPIFQAPDEPQHFSYVQYLAEKKQIPQVKKLDFQPSEQLAKQMEILEVEKIAHNAHIQHSYYRDASERHPYKRAKDSDVITLDTVPSELNYVHNYGPIYYALNVPFYEFFPYLDWQIYSMRIFSVLLSCITVVLAYLTLRRLFDKYLKGLSFNSIFPFAAALFLTLHPQFSFISASVNSDNLIILCFMLFFYLIVRWSGEVLSLQRIIYLFLLGFFSFFVKTHGVILLALIIIYVFFDLLRRKSWKKLLVLSAGSFAAVLISASIFFDQVLKGFLNAGSTVGSYFAEHSVLWFLKTITFTRLFRTYKSFWGRYGWLDTLMPEWAYYLLFFLMMLAVAGLVFFFIKKWQKLKAQPQLKFLLAFFAGSILLVDFTYTVLFAKDAILNDYYNFPTQGRYYFIVLLPIIFFLMLGIASLFKKKWQKYGLSLAIYLVFFVHTLSLFALIPVRYYL